MDVSLGDLYLDLRILGNSKDKCIQIIMDAVTMGMWASWDKDKSPKDTSIIYPPILYYNH